MLGALCYVCVPNIHELTIKTFQLELGEFAPGLEQLEFVSGECSSTICAQIINRTFVHKRLTNICTQIVNRTFVHKRLTNILVDRLQSVFCQIFQSTVCSPFFAQTVDRYIGTKKEKKIQ